MCLGNPLGLLEALLGGLCIQKPKKVIGFLRFLKMQVFGFLKCLVAFLGSPWLPLGPNESKMGAKMVSKRDPKSDQKMNRQRDPTHGEISNEDRTKMGPNLIKYRSDPKCLGQGAGQGAL